jgi:peptide-N4-(N-acetyl-beta-glucosaminyl)asparagine amidase
MSFEQQVLHTSEVPLAYENSALLDKALEILPLERLYSKAEIAESQDSNWGHQDHLIRELLNWFKHDFFSWVNAPPCSTCGSETVGQGSSAPTEQERRDGAGHVELFLCKSCGKGERFPRYNNAGTLLQTRRGRCGEWANVGYVL